MNRLFENSHATHHAIGILVLTLAVLLLIWQIERRSRPAKAEPRPAGRRTRQRSETPLAATKRTTPVINRDPEQLASAALRSIERVMALTDSVATTEAERSGYRDEVERSVAALVSAIILADGVVHVGECRFVRTLMKHVESDDDARAIIAVQAGHWKELRGATPGYFQAVVNYDRLHQTRRSQHVLAELRRIVRWTGLADGNYVDAEFAAASGHLARLEAVLKQATWVVQWDQADAQQRIAFDRMYRRDEFSAKEII